MAKIESISIHGLGFLGTALAAGFAKKGIFVSGIDKSPEKVDSINKGRISFGDKEVISLIRYAVKKKKILATTDFAEGTKKANIHFVCVGTPVRDNGTVILNSLFDVAKALGSFLKKTSGFHLIVIKSTVPPGTTAKVINLIKQRSGKNPGRDFSVVMSPEFLREGYAILDFYNPPFTVIGAADSKGGKLLEQLYKQAGLKENIFHMKLHEAELFKYANNSFHALKVVFANEMARICSTYRIDAKKIMETFAKDKRLNLSSQYLSPGFAFGGSCLPKDLRAIARFDDDCQLFRTIIDSNQQHISFVVSKIKGMKCKHVLLSGIAFKKDMGDFRESPYIFLMRQLLDVGIAVNFIDPLFEGGSIFGANKTFILNTLPDLAKHQIKRLPKYNDYDVILIGCDNYIPIIYLKKHKKTIIDLQGTLYEHKGQFTQYFSIWDL
jgi:GDP-mannose 6-dehydrogenase